MSTTQSCLLSAALFILLGSTHTMAQGTAFIYQGKLMDLGVPAGGSYDFQFKLFGIPVGGSQFGPTLTPSSVLVTNGIFTVTLDFGANFPGADRFLEIGIRPGGSPPSTPYTILTPRQQITTSPYSIKSLNSGTADSLSLSCVGCVTSTQIGSVAGSSITGQIPISSIPGGSGSYVQNTTSLQASSNFNISGDGTAGGTLTASNVTAATQFNIGANRVLSIAGTNNLFVGAGAGTNNTGLGNTFAGRSAGLANTIGSGNSFFGASAGAANTQGSSNSLFGANAGASITTASNNSSFGYHAGELNTASNNSFFGATAGDSNTTGSSNSFFGASAGDNNTTGSLNSFFGKDAGGANSTGGSNSFFGVSAGLTNQTGTSNSFFGTDAGHSNTADGNSFFGRSAGFDNTIGTSNSFFGLNAGRFNTTGGENSYFGVDAGRANLNGCCNAFVGLGAGMANTSGSSNTFIGRGAGLSNTTGSSNTAVGYLADVGAGNLTHATAIGADAIVSTSNTIEIGRSNGFDDVLIPGVVNRDGTLSVGGSLHFLSIPFGGDTVLCVDFFFNVSRCSSSLRYKTNIETFTSGLNLVQQLRPITFTWRTSGHRDLGLGAEDVERVEPLLVTYNNQGQVEGVKYDRIAVVLINAVREQQSQIETQHIAIQQQQAEIRVLKELICSDHPNASICLSKMVR